MANDCARVTAGRGWPRPTSTPAIAFVLFVTLAPVAGADLFSPPFLSYDTGLVPRSVAIADLNGDARPDVVTANYGYFGSHNSVSVLLGNGNGTFAPVAQYDTGPGVETCGRYCPVYLIQVVIADFDADGRPDLAVPNPGPDAVSVLMGNGDGTFAPKVDFATGVGPIGLGVADLNGDGRPDLVASNAYQSTVSVLLGNGDGTFGPKTDFGTGAYNYGMAIADMNADGRPDVVTANSFGNTVSVLLGNGDGTLGGHHDFATGPRPLAVAIADLDADGRLDVAVANGEVNHDNHDPTPEFPMTVSLLRGNGDGTLGPHTELDATVTDPDGAGIAVAIADLNEDGRPDLALAGSNAWVMLGNGDGTFADALSYATNRCYGIAVGDLDANGLPDLVTANSYGSYGPTPSVTVLLHSPDVTTATLQAAFDATAAPDRIEVRWSFGDPTRVAAVALERASASIGPWRRITPELQREGDATTALDRTADPGRTSFYRLDVTLVDGSNLTLGPVSATAGAIGASAVTQLVPDPARSVSRIDYSVARAGRVQVEVTDVGGRVVTTLVDGDQGAGRYHVTWDGTIAGRRLPAGLYFVRLRAPDRTVATKLTRLP